MSTDRLGCIIVGFGYMGEIRKRVAEASGRLNVLAVVDPDPSKRAKVSGCSALERFDEALSLNPEIVFVCTPNVYAPEIAIRCLKAGKHVFCEKPPGRTLEDIQNIKTAANGRSKLMFGFNHRFHPAVLKAKAIIDSGRMGKVITLRGIYGKSGGRDYRSSWRNDKSISGGGILLDQGIHMLDLFRYLAGDFSTVKCVSADLFWQCQVEDNAFVILTNPSGPNASLHSSATLWKHTFRIDVTMERGYMVVEGLLSKSGSYGREHLIVAKRQFEDEANAVGNPSEEVTHFDRDLSWELEVQEFLRCIDEDAPVTISSADDAYRVMQIIDAAYQDAALNRGMVLE